MKIAIIGGSGFVGTSLVERLYSCFDVRILDKALSHSFPKLFSYLDVTSISDLDNNLSNDAAIINLAAEHKDDVTPRSLYYDVNVEGAKNICSIASAKNINKIIFTSTVAVYGFAPLNTGESGKIAPFNDYGLSKSEAEQIYRRWQLEDPLKRTLVIVRPTVIFGERNRGNVYNLFKQIASGQFVMVGNGFNRKSLAYVENVVAFLEFSLSFAPGIHTYNYIDKPDLTMNQLVSFVNKTLCRSTIFKIRLPYWFGLLIGNIFDLVACILNRKFSISAIRVKKFCSNSVYESAAHEIGFVAPIPLLKAIEKTLKYEFIEPHSAQQVFYSE